MSDKEYKISRADLEEELAQALKKIKNLENDRCITAAVIPRKTINDITGIKGKIIRAPRSCWRIVSHPQTVKEILKKHSSTPQKEEQPLQELQPEVTCIKSSDVKMSPVFAERIPTIEAPDNNRGRINIVTDSLSSDSLFGGVATALIIATEFANTYDYELRIITLTAETNPLDYQKIMRSNHVQPARKISFFYNLQDDDFQYKLEVTNNDYFIATSWWTAKTISETIHGNFFYLIQEVETFFYNYSDARLACDQIMSEDNRIAYLVNSHYLFDYFKEHYPNITKNGICFEPAFPQPRNTKNCVQKNQKHRLFFYARPNHPRNLYAYGIHIIDLAIQQGVLDTEKWDIYFAGINSQQIEFSDGTKNINLGLLSLNEYYEFLATVDIGLSLMYTPHPSYPPYEIANSGGIVLSNKMMNKVKFSECKNIILSDLDDQAFMKNFTKAIMLATNKKTREDNFLNSKINSDWHKSLKNTIKYMKEQIDGWKKA